MYKARNTVNTFSELLAAIASLIGHLRRDFT